MTADTRPVPPPSLVVRKGRVIVRLREDGVCWQDSRTVTHIPYQAVDRVSVTPAGRSRVRLQITVRPALTEHRGPYELPCHGRHGHLFAAALERLVREAGTARRADDVRQPPAVTVAPVRSLSLRERHPPVRLALFALLAADLITSLVLLAMGRPGHAIGVWLSIPAWAVTVLIARLLPLAFAGVRDPWLRGIRVEAHYLDSRVSHIDSESWPEFIYEFTDSDGVRREHAVQPPTLFSKPPPKRTLWYVPDAETSHTLGDPFTDLFRTVVTAGMVLFLGCAALYFMPGLLIGVLLG
jgi:hypothetical protein